MQVKTSTCQQLYSKYAGAQTPVKKYTHLRLYTSRCKDAGVSVQVHKSSLENPYISLFCSWAAAQCRSSLKKHITLPGNVRQSSKTAVRSRFIPPNDFLTCISICLSELLCLSCSLQEFSVCRSICV